MGLHSELGTDVHALLIQDFRGIYHKPVLDIIVELVLFCRTPENFVGQLIYETSGYEDSRLFPRNFPVL